MMSKHLLNLLFSTKNMIILSSSLILNATAVHAQKSNIISKCNEYQATQNSFNTEACDLFKIKALSVFEKSGIHFSIQFFNEHSRTYLEIMRRNYEVKAFEQSGDIVPQEVACFDCYMFTKFEQKYGLNSLRKAEQWADSLDKIGLGYHAPYLADKSSTHETINKQLQNYPHITRSNKVFGLSFVVDANDKIENIVLFNISIPGRPSVIPLKHNEVYYKEIKKLLCSLKFCAAKFEGKNVDAEMSVIINKK